MKKESFSGLVEIFPDGWYYTKVPTQNSNPYLDHLKRGNIPIIAQVGNSKWSTLLWGFGDQTFFITLPTKIRRKEKIAPGNQVGIQFELRKTT